MKSLILSIMTRCCINIPQSTAANGGRVARRPHISAQMCLKAASWPCCLTRFITAQRWRSWHALVVVPDVPIDCAFPIVNVGGVGLGRISGRPHVTQHNGARPDVVCAPKTKLSLLELACWSLFSVFLYKAAFWLTCRYRKQRSAAQNMWSDFVLFFFFFGSSTLVTISCKENRSFTKKVWPEEGFSRRKCLQLSQYSGLCCKARWIVF